MKALKNIFLVISILCIALNAKGECNIHMMVTPISQGEEVPDGVNDMLMTRLSSAIAKTDVTADEYYGRFFITGKFNHIYKSVVAGPPSQSVLHTMLTLYVGDIVSKQTFSTATFELRGVGTSEHRAYLNSLSSINSRNKEFEKFIREGEKKIISYYNENYRTILEQANRAASLRNYEEALYHACSIPECCVGYAEAENVVLSIFQEYIDFNGLKLLNSARAAWGTNPDARGAEEAYAYLIQIDPSSKCYSDAQSLGREIASKIQRNWDFENIQKYEDEVDIRKREIEAARAVGVAYGQGQQPQTTNLMWLK